VVTGVDRYLNKELWTPQAFERDFGEEPADLVDCQLGMVLLQLPSKTFWAGFDNMSCECTHVDRNEKKCSSMA
jgi:lysine-specific demethylase 3